MSVSGTGSVVAGTGDDYLASLTIASGGSYSATSGTTTINGLFDNNNGASGITHNSGTFAMCGVSANPYVQVDGATFYNFSVLNCENRVYFQQNITIVNNLYIYETGHPSIITGGATLTMGNSSQSGIIDGINAFGRLYLSGDSTIKGYDESNLAIIRKGPVTSSGTRYLKWVDLQGDLEIANQVGSFTFQRIVKAQNITIGESASLVFENDSTVTIDKLNGSGTFIAGNGSMTKNNNDYFEINLDDAALYSFDNTTISYGNNTGSLVIDARNAIDGGNNIPAEMWKFGNLSVDFVEPEDEFTSGELVFMRCNASGDAEIRNISVFISEKGEEIFLTNSVSGTSAVSDFNYTHLEDFFTWTCRACDDHECVESATSRTINWDSAVPSVSVVSPVDPSYTNKDYMSLKVSTMDDKGAFTFINDSSLLGYWSFDDVSGTTVTDSSGNGNDGTINNGVKQWNGYFGKGGEFDGDLSEVTTGSSQLVPAIASGTPYSHSLWIYPKATQTGHLIDDEINQEHNIWIDTSNRITFTF